MDKLSDIQLTNRKIKIKLVDFKGSTYIDFDHETNNANIQLFMFLIVIKKIQCTRSKVRQAEQIIET